MTTKKQPVVGTSRGTPLTDDDIQRLADEAEAGYDPSRLRPRSGRPRMGSAPAEVVPVRLDPELRAAVATRGLDYFEISAATGAGIDALIGALVRRLEPAA